MTKILNKVTNLKINSWKMDLMDHTTSHKALILKKLCFNFCLIMKKMFIPNWFKETEIKTSFASFHLTIKIRWRLLLEWSQLMNGKILMNQKFTLLSKVHQNTFISIANKPLMVIPKIKISQDKIKKIHSIWLPKWPKRD